MFEESTPHGTSPTLLFLCTGNYYRSRFAEFYFRHLAERHQLAWHVESRGLEPHDTNPGELSRHTIAECERLGVSFAPLRMPLALQADDLRRATRVIAVKEAEHRPLMQRLFAEWVDRIEYWHIHDLDVSEPVDTLATLRAQVEELIRQLLGCDTTTSPQTGVAGDDT
ncbi:MAG: low molecular weight phosphatase family protein [Planctomycetales bacterium]|nr:low molecular weight phosphatase family protein [Planctomycetales bacterium]